MAALNLHNINKNYGSACVLRGVSLDIKDGEFITLLGPSGCGKSTLLRIIAGLEGQDQGSIAIAGRTVDDDRPKQRDVAMVFQSYALYPHMTVAQNIAVPLTMRQLRPWQRFPFVGRMFPSTRAVRNDIEREVAKVARSIGIDHLLGRKPSELSGGQRQRVAVGRAMVRHPAVFLMDEPLSNLDSKLRVQMRMEIKELHRRLGVTFVYVTHDQAEAMTLSDRVAVMLEGQLLQVSAPSQIYADPDDRRVAEFIGTPKMNLLEARGRANGSIGVAGSMLSIKSPCGDAGLTVGIRPEAFFLTDHAGANVFSGIVRLVENMGSDLHVYVDVPGSETPVVARVPAERGSHAVAGRQIHLGVHREHVLLFSKDGRRIRPKTAVVSLGAYA